MKRGVLVRIRTGYSAYDGELGLVLDREHDEYFKVFLVEHGMHFYLEKHLEVISE